jgi:hypothetical protein
MRARPRRVPTPRAAASTSRTRDIGRADPSTARPCAAPRESLPYTRGRRRAGARPWVSLWASAAREKSAPTGHPTAPPSCRPRSVRGPFPLTRSNDGLETTSRAFTPTTRSGWRTSSRSLTGVLLAFGDYSRPNCGTQRRSRTSAHSAVGRTHRRFSRAINVPTRRPCARRSRAALHERSPAERIDTTNRHHARK